VLNHRQTAFVQAYLKSGNATKSAIQAGYSPKTAYSNGQRLLKNDEVARVLQQYHQEAMIESKITVEDVLRRINYLADNAKEDYAKLKALEMLCKHLGIFITVNEVIDRMSEQQLEDLIEKIMQRK